MPTFSVLMLTHKDVLCITFLTAELAESVDGNVNSGDADVNSDDADVNSVDAEVDRIC